MGFVKKVVGGIAKIAAPVLSIAAIAFPPLAPVALVTKLATSAAQNIKGMFQNFPAGLLKSAVAVGSSFLPSPGGVIGEFLKEPGKKLAGLIPQGALSFLPKGIQPKIPGAIDNVMAQWMPALPLPK